MMRQFLLWLFRVRSKRFGQIFATDIVNRWKCTEWKDAP